jgi:hypothetical protein
MLVTIPAAIARRTIIRRASCRAIRASVSVFRPRPPGVRKNSEVLSSSPPSAWRNAREVGVQKMFEQVVRGHFVPLAAAFFVQADPPFALRIIILDVHVQRRQDAREGVDQQRHQRAVAQCGPPRCDGGLPPGPRHHGHERSVGRDYPRVRHVQ